MKAFLSKYKTVLIIAASEAAVMALLVLLKKTGAFYRPHLLGTAICALLGFDALLIFLRFDRARRSDPAYRRARRIALAILCIALLASGPLFVDYLPLVPGHDLEFHLVRIEGVADGIRDGQFPVRLHPETLSGYGYACPLFYPELLLYFPALLRLLGLPVTAAFQCFCFFINLLTAAIAYLSFKKLFASRRLGLIGSFLYTLSLYRLTCLYTRAAIGEVTAMIFLPLVIYGVYRILTAELSGPGRALAALPLTLGMTGLLSSHVLTSAVAALALLLLCLVFIRKFFDVRRLKLLLWAALGTIALTAAFLFPMLDAMDGGVAILTETLQNRSVHAINPYQLFPLIPAATGISLWPDAGVAGEMPLGVGLAVLLGGILFCFLRTKRPEDPILRAGTVSLCFLVPLLLLTTWLFPWDALYDAGGLLERIAGTLQFPWRLLSVCSVLSAMVLVSAIREANILRGGALLRAVALSLCLLTLITGAAYQDALLREASVYRPQTGYDVDRRWGIMNGEYLPATASRERSDYVEDAYIPSSDALSVSHYSRSGSAIMVELTNAGPDIETLTLPRLLYPGYQARVLGGEPLPLAAGRGGRIAVTVPAGFSGRVEVFYRSLPLWRAAEALSLLSGLALCVLFIRKRRLLADATPYDEPRFFPPEGAEE